MQGCVARRERPLRLRHRGGLSRVERPDQHVRAFLDQPLGARARGVHVRLVVGAHDLDVDAEHLPDHARREVGAFLARLADEALHARARQDYADAQLLRLRADIGNRGKRGARYGRDT